MVMKIENWLEYLPEPYRSKAFYNRIHSNPWNNTEAVSLRTAVVKGFFWSSTIEGYDYWNKVANKITKTIKIEKYIWL